MTKLNRVKENQREIEYPGNAGYPLLVIYIVLPYVLNKVKYKVKFAIVDILFHAFL